MADSLALRPRSAGEIVDASIQLIRRGWREMFVIALALMIPTLGLFVIFALAGADMTGAAGASGSLLLFGILSMLWTAVVFAGLIIAASEIYVHGRVLTVAAILRAGLGRMWPVIIAYIGWSLVTGFGIILLIVPGLWAATVYSLSVPIVAIENLGASKAWERSQSLTKGHRWHAFKALALMVLIVMVVAIPTAMLTTPISLAGYVIVAQVIGTIINAAIYPIFAAGLVVLYYDLRIRKEGFDIEHMAGTLTPGVPSAAPVTR